jgi:hypothetical protein
MGLAHIYVPSPWYLDSFKTDAPIYAGVGLVSTLGIIHFKSRSNKKLQEVFDIYNNE